MQKDRIRSAGALEVEWLVILNKVIRQLHLSEGFKEKGGDHADSQGECCRQREQPGSIETGLVTGAAWADGGAEEGEWEGDRQVRHPKDVDSFSEENGNYGRVLRKCDLLT